MGWVGNCVLVAFFRGVCGCNKIVDFGLEILCLDVSVGVCGYSKCTFRMDFCCCFL